MPNPTDSRVNDILRSMIDREPYPEPPTSSTEELLIELSEVIASGGGGGGGGTTTAGVTRFNGRRGNVTPQSGDYSAQQISTRTAGKSVQAYIDEYDANKTLDTQLNESSEKAVQNKVIAVEINDLKGKMMPPGGGTGSFLVKNSNANYDTKWATVEGFMTKNVYDRNNNGKVDKAELTDAVKGPIYQASLKGTRANTYLLTEEDKGVANGVVPLDSTKKILPEYLPDSIMNGLTHGGIFNATTRVVTLTDAAKSILGVTTDTMTLENSPTVPAGYPANAELYYICTQDGSFANMDFVRGDWLISLGNQWNQLKNGNQVSSVLGMTGAVTFNSDQVPQGALNLYFTQEERAKLRGIDENATKEDDVIQSATVTTNPSGVKVLRLANKNGTITEFEGNDADMSEYLKKNGNGSQVTTTFTRATARTPLNGNETLSEAFGKISKWLYDLQQVAYSANYSDLINKPRYTGDFENNGAGNANYPYIDRRVDDLINYWNKTNSYSKAQVDELLEGLESVSIKIVSELPTRNIDQKAEYWIAKNPGPGYSRHRYVQGAWADLGDTDIDLTDYLMKDGESSNTFTTLTIPAVRTSLANNDTLTQAFGKIAGWYNEFADIVFSGSYEDLIDKELLALKTDLDEYLKKQFPLTDAGKVLVIGDDGLVTVTTMTSGIMRRGTGTLSMIGNDLEETPVNEARGSRATALGYHTKASGQSSLAIGMYNKEDLNSNFAFQIGGGTTEANREDIVNVRWNGEMFTKGQISMGDGVNNLIEPTAPQHVTNKYYVDFKITEEIANAGLLKAMIVDVVPLPDDADMNTLYLVPDPTSEGHYNQYKKVLVSQNPDSYIMANLGGTQLTMEGSQVKNLPPASAAYANKVYQYVGDNSALKFGAQYACIPMTFYAWYDTNSSKNYFTDTLDLHPEDPIYATQASGVYHVATKIGPTDAYLDLPNRIRDQFNTYGQPTWYTRNSSADTIGNYRWVPLFTELKDIVAEGTDVAPLSDSVELASVDFANNTINKVKFENLWSYIKYKAYQISGGILKGMPTSNRAIISNESGQLEASTVSSTELEYVKGVTSSIQTQLDALDTKITDYWKTIYPIGSIYITGAYSKGPGELFGGTWTVVASGQTLWGTNTTSEVGKSYEATLPNIKGATTLELTKANGWNGAMRTTKNSGNRQPTWEGDGSWGSLEFNANKSNSIYKDNATVRPPSYVVMMWRRTA